MVAHYDPEGLELITCVIQRGKGDAIAKAAIESGAGGATIFYARGMGLRERLGLLGLAIVPEKEVVMIVCKKEEAKEVFTAVVKAGRLETPGMGIAYISPIHAVAGLFPSGTTYPDDKRKSWVQRKLKLASKG